MKVRLHSGMIMELLDGIWVKLGWELLLDMSVGHGKCYFEHTVGEHHVEFLRVNLGMCCAKLAIRLAAFEDDVRPGRMWASTLVAHRHELLSDGGHAHKQDGGRLLCHCVANALIKGNH